MGYCVDDGMIRSRNPEWLQWDINVLIGIFKTVGVMTNVEKFKTMNCQLGEICAEMLEKAGSCRRKLEGVTYQECLKW